MSSNNKPIKTILEEVSATSKVWERKVKSQTFDYIYKKAASHGHVSNQYSMLVPITKARQVKYNTKQKYRKEYKRKKGKELNRIIQLMIPDGKQLQKEVLAGMYQPGKFFFLLRCYCCIINHPFSLFNSLFLFLFCRAVNEKLQLPCTIPKATHSDHSS